MRKEWRARCSFESAWRLGESERTIGYYRTKWGAGFWMKVVFILDDVSACWLEHYENGKWVEVKQG
jgi:hypothetical protein